MTRARGAAAVAVFAGLLGLVCATAFHGARARQRRLGDRSAILGLSRQLPGPDLALGNGARHLRFLSLEEPGAAFADMPAGPDTDPAGGAIAPPIDVWVRAAGGPGGR